MAFDTETRGKLQRFVTEIRGLLAEDFTRQLQQTYGMDPASGEVAPVGSLKHLDDARLESAHILREIMEHYFAAEAKKDNAARIAVLERIAREQAFTILNRLAALRMMEARGLLLESLAKGTQSQAFQLYQRVANGALGDTGETYKHFLNSLFDLYAADLPSLFDRLGPQSRLFPRETTLTKALELINGSEIAPLWTEDETIGWIYQYFNSKEERRAMREASQAPRNSRELAVRNQFFTPRYVVEFLIDNTLGRLWYDQMAGRTCLAERCRYLLFRPAEVFLGRASAQEKGPVAIAKLLLEGDFDRLPKFDTTPRGIEAMIALAHCVDPNQRVAEVWGGYSERLSRILRSESFDSVTTQELWDGLYLECRSDRHGGTGAIYREDWFRNACIEIVARLKDRKDTVIRAYRPARDPRTIKLLDPACGSMHFGLYAFDLFQEIYREAWDWELANGSDALDREIGGSPDLKPLSETYPDQDAFLCDVPRLIIEHNIYGVDIDPRAAQIASLAMWLRAQRAWHESGVKAKDRPQRYEKTVSAVLHELMILGEASARLSNKFRENHNEIPFYEAIGMRNRIVHEYLAVRLETVWQTCSDDLPELKKSLESLV